MGNTTLSTSSRALIDLFAMLSALGKRGLDIYEVAELAETKAPSIVHPIRQVLGGGTASPYKTFKKVAAVCAEFGIKVQPHYNSNRTLLDRAREAKEALGIVNVAPGKSGRFTTRTKGVAAERIAAAPPDPATDDEAREAAAAPVEPPPEPMPVSELDAKIRERRSRSHYLDSPTVPIGPRPRMDNGTAPDPKVAVLPADLRRKIEERIEDLQNALAILAREGLL